MFEVGIFMVSGDAITIEATGKSEIEALKEVEGRLASLNNWVRVLNTDDEWCSIKTSQVSYLIALEE